MGRASGGGATGEQGAISTGMTCYYDPAVAAKACRSPQRKERILPSVSKEWRHARHKAEACAQLCLPHPAPPPARSLPLLQARRVAQRRAGGLDQRRGVRKPAPKASNGRWRARPHGRRRWQRQRQHQQRRRFKDQGGGQKRRRRQQPERGRRRKRRGGGRRQERRGCYRGRPGEEF